jgi:hypothetical protein
MRMARRHGRGKQVILGRGNPPEGERVTALAQVILGRGNPPEAERVTALA